MISMAVLTPFFDVVAGVAILAGRSSLLDKGVFKTANTNFTVRHLLALGFIGYGGWNLWKIERAQDKLKKTLDAESFGAENCEYCNHSMIFDEYAGLVCSMECEADSQWPNLPKGWPNHAESFAAWSGRGYNPVKYEITNLDNGETMTINLDRNPYVGERNTYLRVQNLETGETDEAVVLHNTDVPRHSNGIPYYKEGSKEHDDWLKGIVWKVGFEDDDDDWDAESFGADSFDLETHSGHEVQWDDGSFYMTFKEPIDGYGEANGHWYGGERESPDEITLDVEPAWDEETDEEYDVPSLHIQVNQVEYYGIKNHNMSVSPDGVASPELLDAIQEGLAWMVADHADKTVVGREYRGESFADEDMALPQRIKTELRDKHGISKGEKSLLKLLRKPKEEKADVSVHHQLPDAAFQRSLGDYDLTQYEEDDSGAESFGAENKNEMELILADGGWEGSMVLSGDEDAIKYIIKQSAFIEEYRPDIGMPEDWDMKGKEWLDQWFEDNDLETIAQETGWTITRVSSNAVFWGNRKGIIVADETWWTWGEENLGLAQ